MRPEFFQSAKRVRDLRAGPGGPLVTSFAEKLRQDGYAELTARRHLRSAEHLAHWASRVGVALDGPIAPILDGFDRHVRRRPQCRGHACHPFGHTCRVQILCGARLFLQHLADAELASHHSDNLVVSFPPLFASFVDGCSNSVAPAQARCRITGSTSASCSHEWATSLPDGMLAACASSSWRAAGRAGGRQRRSARPRFGCFAGF